MQILSIVFADHTNGYENKRNCKENVNRILEEHAEIFKVTEGKM